MIKIDIDIFDYAPQLKDLIAASLKREVQDLLAPRIVFFNSLGVTQIQLDA